jgi:phosphotransferase system enzyme I (PtsI)
MSIQKGRGFETPDCLWSPGVAGSIVALAADGAVTNVLGRGVAGGRALATGVVVEWEESFFEDGDLRGAVLYFRGDIPLIVTAYAIEHGISALLVANGGRNYHPLILAREAGIPVIVGVGQLEITGRLVTVDGQQGVVYQGAPDPESQLRFAPPDAGQDGRVPVYANIGYPAALAAAAKSGAAGLGLFRTEFTAVRSLALHLLERLSSGERLIDVVRKANEADAIYRVADDPKLAPLLVDGFEEAFGQALDTFGSREIFIRTMDIARGSNDPMGNRGIRRDVAEGGASIRLIGKAILRVLAHRDANIGVILPLVSHYPQISFAAHTLLASGLTFAKDRDRDRRIMFGWEIEQPAAAMNQHLWMHAYEAEFGFPPDLIGIGTNDLTQFTLAVHRDIGAEERSTEVHDYLSSLYDERDYSVVRQIAEVAAACRGTGTRVFLLGQAAANPLLAPLLLLLGVAPSVGIGDVAAVRKLFAELDRRRRRGDLTDEYVRFVSSQYPANARKAVEELLVTFFLDVAQA